MNPKIGNCGWGYLSARQYFGSGWNRQFKSKLQAYASLFDLVEVNSTFYRIPKLSTAKKWRQEADQINPKFEFTVKVSQLVTHKTPFTGQAYWAFEQIKAIANALRAKVLLFQSPGSFKPTQENLKKAREFFSKIKREDFILVWEVRWAKNWTPEIVKQLFKELEVNQCVDPFRQNTFYAKNLLYYRLHGLGKPSMYNYSFSDKELKGLHAKTRKSRKPVYILFNNTACYENALTFKELVS